MIIKTAKEVYDDAVEEELKNVMNKIEKNKISRSILIKIQLKETISSLKESGYLIFPDKMYNLTDYYPVQW